MRIIKHGSRSFPSTAAKIWNSLPQHLCDISNFGVFKNQINAWGGAPVHVHCVPLVEMFYLLVCLVAKFYAKASYFPVNTYVVGTQKNHLNETVLLSNQNTLINKISFNLFRII